MATAAARPRKRDLAPDWRDALRASIRRLALRTWGALLIGLSIGGAVALATHSATDPSFSTAAAGPPANWIGTFGAYFSDALLLLFGIGSALLMPVIAMAGLRMLRLEPSGRIGGIDDDRRQAAGVERGGQSQADHAPAEDDHVRAVHGGASRRDCGEWATGGG